MNIKTLAEDYYLNKGYNCAEAMVNAANDYYCLDLNDNALKLMAALGGGVQTGNNCGAILGGTAILSLLFTEDKAHQSPNLKPVVIQYINAVKEKLGSIDCKDIKPIYTKPEVRCLAVIDICCDILDSVIMDYCKSNNLNIITGIDLYPTKKAIDFDEGDKKYILKLLSNPNPLNTLPNNITYSYIYVNGYRYCANDNGNLIWDEEKCLCYCKEEDLIY